MADISISRMIGGIKEFLGSRRAREAQKRLLNAYRRQKNDRPPIIQGYDFLLPKYFPQEMAKDPEKNLLFQTSQCYGGIQVGSDYYPSFDMSMPFGTVMVPEAFGCQIEWMPEAAPWAKPMITSPGQVYSLKAPKLSEAKMINEIKKHIDYANRQTGGKIPMRIIDMQCPFSASCQVWDAEELMMACYTNPKEVHHLLRIMTDFSIEFIRTYISWLPNIAYPGRDFPAVTENIGITIADDTPLIMLSNELYHEFALPYNIEVAKAFGKISVHSCGDYARQLDNMMEIPGLTAIQCHIGPGEMKALPLLEKMKGKVTIWADWNPVTLGGYADARQLYEQYSLVHLKNFGAGLILLGVGGKDLGEIKANYQWLCGEFK